MLFRTESNPLKTQSLSPQQRIIFALDFPSFDEARPYIEELKDHVGIFKIGWTLFMGDGLNVINKIQKITGANKFFLDFKFSSHTINDIPKQRGGVKAVFLSRSQDIEFITVHTHEEEKAVSEVVKQFKTGEVKVLGVTVLTSSGREDIEGIGQRKTVEERVLDLARKAKNAGCHGVVCSGQEARSVRAEFGKDFIIITPGIRPQGSHIHQDDQRRTVTPGDAVRNGADYIVVGRPISEAKDPIEAAQKIAKEIQEALKQ